MGSFSPKLYFLSFSPQHEHRNSASESIKQKLIFVGSEEGKLLALRQSFAEVCYVPEAYSYLYTIYEVHLFSPTPTLNFISCLLTAIFSICGVIETFILVWFSSVFH